MQLSEVKRAMAEKTKIIYEDGEYYVSACIMRIYRNAWYYQIELHSFITSSIVIVDMEKTKLGGNIPCGGNDNA